MTKAEIKEILKKEYGYKDSDFIDKDGKEILKKDLEDMLAREEKNKSIQVEEDGLNIQSSDTLEKEKDSDLAFFDRDVNESQLTNIKENDLIVVMSGLQNKYVHTSRNGNRYTFKYFGHTEKMPYSEIQNIRNLTPKVFDEGWLIILNVDVIKNFGLEDKYKRILTPQNADEILKKDSAELSEFAKQLPKGLKRTLALIAKKKIKTGELDSKSAIRAIEEGTGITIEEE